MTTGEKIKLYRKKKGLSQKELAELSGVSEISIRKYEADSRKPKIETLLKIADALCAPLETLSDGFRDIGNMLETIKTKNSLENVRNSYENNENVQMVTNVLDMAIRDLKEDIEERQQLLDEESDWFESIKNIYNQLGHEPKRTLVNIVQWFDELNEDGRIALLEQMELIRKIPDYKKSPAK